MPRDPIRFIIQVLIACFLVGLTLSFLGIDPVTLITDAWRIFPATLDMVVEAWQWAWPYILTGAVVVIPLVAVSLVLRTLRSRRSPNGDRQG